MHVAKGYYVKTTPARLSFIAWVKKGGFWVKVVKMSSGIDETGAKGWFVTGERIGPFGPSNEQGICEGQCEQREYGPSEVELYARNCAIHSWGVVEARERITIGQEAFQKGVI